MSLLRLVEQIIRWLKSRIFARMNTHTRVGSCGTPRKGRILCRDVGLLPGGSLFPRLVVRRQSAPSRAPGSAKHSAFLVRVLVVRGRLSPVEAAIRTGAVLTRRPVSNPRARILWPGLP
jgi:hypothetical protein